MPALHKAIAKKDTEAAQNLIKSKGTNLDIRDDFTGKTALHLSIEENNLTLTKALVDAGADVNIKDELGQTDLHTAAEENFGAAELFGAISSGRVNLNSRDMWSCTTTELNRKSVVSLLINAGADIELRNDDGQTALLVAVKKKKNHSEIAKMLIERGADIQSQDKVGQTALMLSVEHFDCVIFMFIMSKVGGVAKMKYACNSLTSRCVP